MIYTSVQGDTLNSIADRLTLSNDYGVAIANLNGFTEDNGVTPWNVYDPLPVGTRMEIPDSWVKAGPVQGMSRNSSLMLLGVGLIAWGLLK